MKAELIVLTGPLTGQRCPLNERSVTIGRSERSDIRLQEPEASTRHCTIERKQDRFVLTDHGSAFGTFVDGFRISEHVLVDENQIGIGETTLLFRTAAHPAFDPVRTTLLRSCTLQFLFRALATAPSAAVLETQIIELIMEFVPARSGAVFLARDEAGVRRLAKDRNDAWESAAARAAKEGIACEHRVAALALYVRGALEGAILLEMKEDPEAFHELFSAIAVMAASALENARDLQSLRTENALLQERLGVDESGIVGASAPIQRLLQMIERVGPQESTVLIMGESGTGKELVARALHKRSPRRQRPFVAINCAALTDTLLESELFGHEKGAFTGAAAQKKGKLEMAEGGTVFLDEIGEMAPQLQAKLLRVLQQREFERVGGTRTLHLNVRLIAATNRDLAAEVKHGTFREDLYHRLNVITLRTPALRERPGDIPALANHFLRVASARCSRRVNRISDAAAEALKAYEWPGNVRELENAIERAVVLGESDVLEIEDLPETLISAQSATDASFQAQLSGAKRESIIRAWEQSGGDYKSAAQILGLHPNSLLRLIRTLGLRSQLRT